jgi:uroporphyrinogen-III synthase
MMPIAVLRPEPGNAATCARIVDAGETPLAMPLFAVRAIQWDAPPPDRFDALLLTSANAARMGGDALAPYRDLPTIAVGRATAGAARAAGLSVVATGASDARGALALLAAEGRSRALHLTGRDHLLQTGGAIAHVAVVYASDALPVDAAGLQRRLQGCVALLHSPRAAARLAELAGDRTTVALAAISANALAAAGAGWAATGVAATPDDAALIAAARALTRGRSGGIRGA